MSEHPEETKASKPKVNSASQKELDKCAQQFDAFNDNVKEMTHDRLNSAPRPESEGHKLSSKEIDRSKDIYLKPKRTIFAVDAKSGKGQTFNENFREEWNFQKEYVHFVFENKESPGDTTTIWTRPFGGLPAEEWDVPTGKPVWGPRYLAEQIKRKSYHRLKMDESTTVAADGHGKYYGAMAVDSVIQRLDAHPVGSRKSIFMGAGNF